MDPQKENVIKLSPEESSRYARHLALDEIGVVGQKKLKGSSVLCVGSGGLGSSLLLYLAAGGVGTIGIVDPDLVESSNLQRQVIHNMNWLNKPKIESAKERILDINPFCKVNTVKETLSQNNALEILDPYDVICDCTDNFPSHYLINDACLILNKPNVCGSIAKWNGQVTVFNLKKDSPNYRDLLPIPPNSNLLPSCSEGGVVGVLPGIIGIIQATEVIKIITGAGQILDGRLLIVDGLSMRFRELCLKPRENQEKIKHLIDYKTFCSSELGSEEKVPINGISTNKLKKLMKNNGDQIVLLDVRSYEEHNLQSIKGAILIPLDKIQNGEAIEDIRSLVKKKTLYVHCKTGIRSRKALIELKKYGIEGFNLNGGIESWT